MKKYIFNLKADHLTNELLEQVKHLAVFIAIYNSHQPTQDFKNFLQNKIPGQFWYIAKGYDVPGNSGPTSYDVYESYCSSQRIGEIQIVEL